MRIILVVCLLAWACEEGSPPEPASAEAPATEIPPAPFEPPEARAQRLTRAQYVRAVEQVLGKGLLIPKAIEPDVSLDGFIAVGASRTTISARGVEQYEVAAFDLAEQAMAEAHREKVLLCGATTACAHETLQRLARLAWRRPASEAELERLTALFDRAEEALEDLHEAMTFPIAAILQSPNFLFRAELGEPDPETPEARHYTSVEMASRLAFFLWNSPPDEALLEAGERGDLVDEAKLEAEVRRMLRSRRARRGFRNFFSEYLQFERLEKMVKDPTVFVHASPELNDSAREETLRNVETLVFDEDGDYRSIMSTRRTFVDRRLAALYGVPAPQAEGFAETWLPEEGLRRGLLGQASLLALNAHVEASSATLRGKFIQLSLLCRELPPPPADVDTSIPEPSPDSPTLRDRVAVHLENPTCAACHRVMDPAGLGLENFDGIGRLRLQENGATIDASGDIDGVEFADPVELAWVIREHPQFGPCLVRQLYRYATGVVAESGQEGLLDTLSEDFERSGFKVKTLLFEIAMSEGFRMAREATDDQ